MQLVKHAYLWRKDYDPAIVLLQIELGPGSKNECPGRDEAGPIVINFVLCRLVT